MGPEFACRERDLFEVRISLVTHVRIPGVARAIGAVRLQAARQNPMTEWLGLPTRRFPFPIAPV